ncbi:Peroxiredoxin PRX1, mitochondrial [Nymphon striatum]|nr:Peroxiredoxin PRX1, mitochondrial [Nymphon striatum]
MGLRINDVVPNFTAETDQGTIQFHDWIGDSWAILFSHPKDFTPVCTTEFGAVAQLSDEWEKRGTKVIGVSVDGVEEHKVWKKDIEKVAGTGAGFPIIADEGLAVSKAFDMFCGRWTGLQMANGNGVATPANWNVGDDVIIPTALDDDAAKAKFGEFETVLPYLRKTKAPS